MTAPVLRLRGIGKRYGTTDVLRDVDLDLAPGRCIGLLGENGAGKSTLVKIISGATAATSGTIEADGTEVQFRSPRDARQLGVQIIPQELAYLPDLSVAENLLLANWPDGKRFVTRRWILAKGREAMARIGLDLDVRRMMRDLTLAERQLVEIAKALLGDARVLILDEPTASLHARESELLLERLAALKRTGVCMIYISHHLDETFRIADEILVLRNGSVVQHTPVAETDVTASVSAMLGEHYEASSNDDDAEPGAVAVRLIDWRTDRSPRLTGCDLDIHAGQVTGIFGLVGAGGETIARGLGGYADAIRGRIVVDGDDHPIPTTPRRALAHGIASVPAERKTEGLALNQSIEANITVSTLADYTAGGVLVRGRAQTAGAGRLADEIDVRRRSVRQEVGELSGGNQQKVLLASRLAAGPRILVLHEPTRGVDIGSRDQIHRRLAEYARTGTAVVVVTSDVQEAVDVTDRLIVMRDGAIVDELAGPRKTTVTALAVAAGGTT